MNADNQPPGNQPPGNQPPGNQPPGDHLTEKLAEVAQRFVALTDTLVDDFDVVELLGLRDEGLVDFRRGRGVIVAGTPARSEVVEHARALVRFARSRGYERDELVHIIRSVS